MSMTARFQDQPAHRTTRRAIVFAPTAAILAAACGSLESGGPAQPTAPTVTVRFWTYSDAATTALFNRYVDSFNKEGRGVVVQHDRVEGSTKAPAAAANSMADLDYSNPNHPVSFAGKSGGMVALDDLVKAKAPAGLPVGEYLPSVWGLYTWKRKQYGIPLQAAIKNFIYNKDYFTEAGITRLPTTWPEFIETGKKLVKRQGDTWDRTFTNVTPTGGGGWNRLWHVLSYRNNAKRVNDDLTRSLANSPESVAAVQFMVDMIHVHKLQPGIDGFSPGVVDFPSGRSAANYGGFQQVTGFLQANPTLKLGTLLPPYGPTPAKVIGIAGECIAMWDSCKTPEQAFRFIRYMCYEKNLQWCKDFFVLPVRKADLSDAHYKTELMAPIVEVMSTHVYLKWMYDLGNTFPFANELAGPLNDGLNAALKQQKSPKAAMDETAEAQNGILAKYRDELRRFLAEQ
jgi:ABC-type glycerol-3-phosphate transport system substrate-binding protein